MERENMTKESRDELLERILEETARKPYKPGNAGVRRNTSQTRRTVSGTARTAAAASTSKNTPDNTGAAEATAVKEEKNNEQQTQVFSNVNAVSGIQNVNSVQSVAAQKVDVNSTQREMESAAEKIQKIKQEKAAAAKAAIMRKAEIDNSIMQQNVDTSAVPQEPPVFSGDDNEKVNIVMTDEDYDALVVEEFEEAKNSVIIKVQNIFQLAVFVFFVFFAVFNFIIPIAGVSGDSMMPTLSDGDKLLTLSSYTPQRGDVVIIDNKTAALIDENGNVTEKSGLDCMISKRIIAVGGDTVDFDFEKGTVTVNGEVLDENYINELTTRDEGAFEYPLTIPQGYVFVLGDNRNISKDSRHSDIGLIPEDEVSGKVLMKIYPFGSIGSVE